MASKITAHDFTFDGGKSKTHYITAGPRTGPLLIFVHGWIAVAETWKEQILAFSALGFYVVAPDTRGYGGSTVTKNISDYALERHVSDLLALLTHLNRSQAVWIGHDWGAGLVWSLAAHHPEVCVGVVGMSVPYRTIEFGLDRLVKLVNRDIYPEEEFPLGNWDYQAYHAEQPERTAEVLDAKPENTIKVLYSAGDTGGYGKPSYFTATLRKNGGWFGPADSAPDIDIGNTLLKNSPDVYDKLVATIRENGTQGPNAYYLNHETNIKYEEKSANGGVLEFPVLFVGGKFDHVCDTATNQPLSESMRKFCRQLTECTIDAGHWIPQEKPAEVNAAIVRWMVENLKSYWPGYWSAPFTSNRE
jgi:soluble epoxide hydrolase/lipid-phosphate phosphatase